MPPAVIDTNVVVSGLITGARDAPTARVLDGMLASRFLFLYSTDLLREYRDVLLRPSLRSLHGFGEDEVDVVLAEIALNGTHRTPAPAPERAPDPGDQHLWDLLAGEPGAVLVTGDGLLLENPPSFAAVLSPRSFARSLQV